ncbi:DNA internalization-related competence protein ComEC/Rec2 [Shewanella sp. 3_MG-2023]|uniref:DNA internalization-related competence protein ComEC/Rec2 n=1 Tax=Shewanella sp. 3_MG-2023 TaxID=3062635 RepID=UPI0026E1AFF0|nr:DNA internalization-related competence protein ComEC/Rec2 [Shewanella sp. 3_MG-2023]MDO6775298.1 DNA internalization-related competence protein ComEC/Rec2 [Shewanella sp. 3_MG-2023]
MINRFVYGFCASVLFSNLLPSLFPISLAVLMFVIGVLTLKRWPFISGCLLGVFWVSICFYSLFSHQEAEHPVRKQFKAQIVSLVSKNSDWISFNVVLLSAQHSLYKRYYRLNWQQAPEVKVGQVWAFDARMKPITSPINQGGFNQQKYLLSQHIVAKGSVKQSQLIDYKLSLRQRVISDFKPKLQHLSHYPIINALLFGDKTDISTEQWQALRSTGTGHLVAISGLHLSVVFGLSWSLFRLLLLNFMATSSRRNLILAVLMAAMVAAGYGYLAGMAISTQRALMMLLMIVLLTVFRQHASTWQRLIWALFAVLVFDPFASLSAGFWLSFSALAIILFTIDYLGVKSTAEINARQLSSASLSVDNEDLQDDRLMARGLRRLSQLKSNLMHFFSSFWAIQWRLFIGLGLVQALLFGSVSIHSIWINFLMVPWFSVVVIPLCIVALGFNSVFMLLPVPAVMSDTLINALLWLADHSLIPFYYLLSLSEQLPLAQFHLSDALTVSLLLLAVGLFLFKWASDIHWRVCFGLMALPFMFQMYDVTKTNAQPMVTNLLWQMHVLDVGQGMAVLLQQGHKGILYDTGAAYGDSFSYAQRVVIPTLMAKGVTELDYLIISHDDNDHAGGVDELVKHFNKVTMISNIDKYRQADMTPEVLLGQQLVDDTQKLQQCDERTFNWFNLAITLTSNMAAKSDNNQSCVVHIDDGNKSVLLAGDIEKQTEQRLIQSGSLLDADILLVPHHGSRTSSSAEFIAAVNPSEAIFTAGFANQYGFPKHDVVERYKTHGVTTLVSGETGQLSIDFKRQSYKIRPYRTVIEPFWYNNLFRFGVQVKPE